MKINKMPVVLVLLILSWVIAILGSVFGGYFIVFKLGGNDSLFFGVLLMLGGLLFGAITRMLANIGQLSFDLNQNLVFQLKSLNQNLNKTLNSEFQVVHSQGKSLNETICSQFQVTYTHFQNLNQLLNFQSVELHARMKELFNETIKMKNDLDLMCCDSKDLNQDIHQLKSFFEQNIGRPHLKK